LFESGWKILTVNVKFIGSFRGLSIKSELELNLQKPLALEEVIKNIAKKVPSLANALSDSSCGRPRNDMLVFVNGKEISVLERFGTLVRDGDEVCFVPVVHGG
jgi:molybdopterin converting factor small subunit